MLLEASGTKQNVLLLWLGNVAKNHRGNPLTANVTVLVIPSSGLDGKTAGIISAAIEWHQYAVAILNWKPTAATDTVLHLCDDRVRRGRSAGNKCRERIASRNPALHPLILRQLS